MTCSERNDASSRRPARLCAAEGLGRTGGGGVGISGGGGRNGVSGSEGGGPNSSSGELGEVASMNDEAMYGPVAYRLGFMEATGGGDGPAAAARG